MSSDFQCPSCGVAVKVDVDRTKYVLYNPDGEKYFSVYPCEILKNERNDGEKHWVLIDGKIKAWVYIYDVYDSLDIAMNVLKQHVVEQQKQFEVAKARYDWRNPVSRMSV